MPWIRCPECNGKGCEWCHRDGWLMRHTGRVVSRFVTRRVQDGAVRIYGMTMRPNSKRDPSQLEGKRLVFGTYTHGYVSDTDHEDMLPFVYLWGSEREHRACLAGKERWSFGDTTYETEDGRCYAWEWWDAELPTA